MTLLERAVWVSIYLECWTNHAVPSDPAELARYLGQPIDEIKAGLTKRVLFFFKKVNEELICPELDEYRETLRLRNLKKSEGGKKGAKRKRDMASRKASSVEGTPRGIPKGSLIQSKLDQSNQNQSINKRVIPVKDSFLKEYEDYEYSHENSSGCY